jgi:hypothetical protein
MSAKTGGKKITDVSLFENDNARPAFQVQAINARGETI